MENTKRISLTTPRTLPETMRAYRIGNPAGQFPVWSAEGAKRTSGRWHEAGVEVIYASENYSTAMLEKLVHWNGTLPPNQHYIEITIPKGTSYAVVTAQTFPECFSSDGEAARRLGRRWYEENPSAILIVPSVVAAWSEISSSTAGTGISGEYGWGWRRLYGGTDASFRRIDQAAVPVRGRSD
jgi:RES domain-containing protein